MNDQTGLKEYTRYLWKKSKINLSLYFDSSAMEKSFEACVAEGALSEIENLRIYKQRKSKADNDQII